MNAELRSVLLGTLGLDVLALLALCLTLARGGVAGDSARIRATLRMAWQSMASRAIHFAEELATGFHERFPRLLGLTPWPLSFFVAFNLFWLALFGLCLRGLAARRRAALFPLWFLGLACIANVLAHSAFSLRVGGYFPGLVTAPLVGVVGAVLLRRLLLVTGGRA